MHSIRNISWIAPATMTGFLLAGVLFALGHHLFYSSLNGTTSASWSYTVWGFGITQQQVNTSGGTALAFLAKVCFVLAISIAYTQAFWRAVGTKITAVRTLDTMSSLLDNILAFGRVTTWVRYPLLLLLGLSVWLVPIASVITPATLSVIVAPVTPPANASMNVPKADFESLKFIVPGDLQYSMAYNGPSFEVNRIAQASAFAGGVLPINPPATNVSWESTFSGPYLKCSNVSDNMRYQVQKNLFTAFVNGSYCANYLNYVSWTASTGQAVGGNITGESYNALPFLTGGSVKPYPMNTGTLGPTDKVNDYSVLNITEPATIYFAVNPSFQTQTPAMCVYDYYTQITDHNYTGFWDNTPMLQCQLHNATYQANFKYTNSIQSIDVSFPDVDQASPVLPLWKYYFDDKNCSAVNTDRQGCDVDAVTLQRLSFQAVMDAFGRLLTGSVHSGGGGYQPTVVASTSVLSTQLLLTDELAFLKGNSTWLPYQINEHHNGSLNSLWDWSSPVQSRPLAEALEELFQNITISMLSSPALQPNMSSPFKPAPVTVTLYGYQTVYTYAAATLWLAYGLAIFLTLVGVIIGLVCVFLNGASFSDDFSTVLRATRNADISVDIRDQDCDGKDPVPKYIADARVTFVGGAFSSARGTPVNVQKTSVQPKSHAPLLSRRPS